MFAICEPVLVTVLSRKRIEEFAAKHADVADELQNWFRIARRAAWKSIADVRVNYRTADQVGRVVIFNIGRNTYRMIVKADFQAKLLMVKELLTHREYGRNGWKKWC